MAGVSVRGRRTVYLRGCGNQRTQLVGKRFVWRDQNRFGNKRTRPSASWIAEHAACFFENYLIGRDVPRALFEVGWVVVVDGNRQATILLQNSHRNPRMRKRRGNNLGAGVRSKRISGRREKRCLVSAVAILIHFDPAFRQIPILLR